jgi:DNA-binding response OmpR family regulator
MGKKRVLVADDEPDVLQVIKAILEHEGIVVHTARDGEQAFKLLKKHEFDAVILDVVMPKVTGVKLLQMMRRSAKMKDTPAMLITGNILKTKQLEDEGVDKLATDLLTKPFNTRDLIKRVKALVDKGSSTASPPSNTSHHTRV